MFSLFQAKKEEKDNNISVTLDDKEVPEEDIGQVALDILELENMLVIVAPIAGPDGDTIDISVSRNILTISGERKKPEAYLSATKVLVEECFFGSFSRSIILPENLALNKIGASMENNLLIVEIPKLQFASKSIKINKYETRPE